MINFSKNIVLPKALIKKGVAILPLEEWERVKEDLEMLQSKGLVKKIQKARKDKKTVSLESILKENDLELGHRRDIYR